MKSLILIGVFVLPFFASANHNSAVSCPLGEMLENQMTDPGSAASIHWHGFFPHFHPAVPPHFEDVCVVDPNYVPPPLTEADALSCSDTLDNDLDTLVDLDDPDCAAFVTPIVNSPESDGGGACFSLSRDGCQNRNWYDEPTYKGDFVPAPGENEKLEVIKDQIEQIKDIINTLAGLM